MTYSLNELESLLRKAAAGAGLPAGHADEIARAGVWLARRGFPVCGIVVSAVAAGMGANAVKHKSSRLIFAGARAAIAGPAAIDLLLAKETGCEIVLRDLDEPTLLLGLAGVAADDHETAFELSRADTRYRIGSLADLTADQFVLPGAGDLIITRVTAASPASRNARAARYDPIAAADTGWDELKRLAAKTYVPASDQSRLKGAGAGLTDND